MAPYTTLSGGRKFGRVRLPRERFLRIGTFVPRYLKLCDNLAEILRRARRKIDLYARKCLFVLTIIPMKEKISNFYYIRNKRTVDEIKCCLKFIVTLQQPLFYFATLPRVYYSTKNSMLNVFLTDVPLIGISLKPEYKEPLEAD